MLAFFEGPLVGPFTEFWRPSIIGPPFKAKVRQIRLEKTGGPLFDVQ
jgi:hypothetical protein